MTDKERLEAVFAERCPSNGEGPEHEALLETDCLVCQELWLIENTIIHGPIMYGADLLVRGPDGVYRPREGRK